MIVNSKKLTKKQLSIIITASILVFLIIAYAVMTLIMSNIDGNKGGDDDTKLPEILEGEDIKGNTAIAYPSFTSSAVQSLYVNSDKGFFGLKLPTTDSEKGTFNTDSEFVFYYEDEYGKVKAYAPPICLAEANFDYTDLYAIQNEDGYNLFKLSYLLAAVGTLYFSERVTLPSDAAERTAAINRYGLSEDKRESFSVTYLDEDKKEVQHIIYIGDQLVTGLGYYFMIDGREDYVYTSINNNFDYALDGFVSFIGSRLVAEGLISDGVYEPYLTTDYKQWETTRHYEKNYSASAPFIIPSDAEIVVNGTYYASEEADSHDGTKTLLSINLSALDDNYGDYSRLKAAFAGKKLGVDSFDGITLTAIVNSNEATLYNSEKGTGKYTYEIFEVVAILTENGETTSTDATISENSLIKVKYTCQIDGKSQNLDKDNKIYYSYGIIDLGAVTPITDAAKSALVGGGVGALSTTLKLDAEYTKENTEKIGFTKEIVEIAVIYEDKTGEKTISTVTENSVVTYRYRTVFRDGEGGEFVYQEGSETVDLSSLTSESDLVIKNKLVGLSRGVLGRNEYLTIISDDTYLEAISSFITYEVEKLSYVVTNELQVAFEFINESERHPFFGESLYKNNLTGKYSSYALNSTSCENIVRILGGISNTSSSQLSEGLVGAETVAVGITPYNMDKYGLYAHKIHFELPRGVETVTNDNGKEEYTYLDKLAFNLYISDEQPDGTRYVGSDMYDVIVKIDGEQFKFVDFSFVEYWARRNVVLVNYSEIDEIEMEFCMEDRLGKYNFDLQHKTVWISGTSFYTEEIEGGTPYDRVVVNVTNLSDSSNISNKFSSMIGEKNTNELLLNILYDNKTIEQDELATSNFKDLLQLMYSTYYAGSLTEAEQKEALTNAPMIMKMKLSLEGDAASRPYVYEFYRVDDRRIMVSLYNVDLSGEEVAGTRVSDFYISTFAFKKIARGWFDLLDGKTINPDVGYDTVTSK